MEAITATILANEPTLRLGVFVGVLSAMMVVEAIAPRRNLIQGRARRWPSNLGIVIVNTLLMRLIIPLPPVGIAFMATERGWGLFNIWTAPTAIALVGSFLLLDIAIYGQHFAFHKVGALWRLHRMHHADVDVDVTTGSRFHPVEIALSIGIKMALVVVIGAPAAAVLLFEIALNATSLFNHANINLPRTLDAAVRLVVVTPDMHRVHHSLHRDETDSNFGFNLPWWDHLFGTYRAQPRDGHEAMALGISEFRDPREQRLDRMLVQPFRDGTNTQ